MKAAPVETPRATVPPGEMRNDPDRRRMLVVGLAALAATGLVTGAAASTLGHSTSGAVPRPVTSDAGPGPRTVAVPAVTGLSYADAQRNLAASGFGVVRTDFPTNDVAPGRVVDQSVPAGTQLNSGATVEVVVAIAAAHPPNGHGKRKGGD